MAAYIMFIREMTLDESRREAYWSNPIKPLAPKRRHVIRERPEIVAAVVAEITSPKVARASNHNPAHQAASQRQVDSWLADMEYCDRF